MGSTRGDSAGGLPEALGRQIRLTPVAVRFGHRGGRHTGSSAGPGSGSPCNPHRAQVAVCTSPSTSNSRMVWTINAASGMVSASEFGSSDAQLVSLGILLHSKWYIGLPSGCVFVMNIIPLSLVREVRCSTLITAPASHHLPNFHMSCSVGRW